MKTHHAIDYIEFPATGTAALKDFYSQAFGWDFMDYGPDYTVPTNAGLDAGFQADPAAAPAKPLVILYSDDLEASLQAVTDNGAEITAAIFTFPGGRRFQFRDPSGNELAVWSET